MVHARVIQKNIGKIKESRISIYIRKKTEKHKEKERKKTNEMC